MVCFRVIKIKFTSIKNIQSEVLQIKWLKIRAKRIFLHKILKDFVCIFQILRFLVKLKANEKAIWKIICIDSNHIVLKPPYMKPKYLPLEPSKQKIECWIRVMVFDGTKKTYCRCALLVNPVLLIFSSCSATLSFNHLTVNCQHLLYCEPGL
jgi:hypothetical protein